MKKILMLCLFAVACAGMPFPGFVGGKSSTEAHKTETSSSSHEELINGKPVASADDDDGGVAKHIAKKENKKGDIGKTCHHNNECGADACYVGYGDLGYCTKMCDSWSDCPTHWECKKARNAPQRICMQDAD